MSNLLRLTSRCGVWIAVLAFMTPAGAATFCAHNAAEIQSALTAAQANGEDDSIRIVTGNYVLTTGLTFVSTEAHGISFNGYYNDSLCTVFDSKSIGATLDGNHLVRPLYVSNPNGYVEILRLNFAAGQPASGDSGGGLLVAASVSTVVQYSRFYGNHTTGANALGGALYVVSSGVGVFTDNLLFGNHGTEVGGAIWQQASSESYVNRNTIVGNITDTLGDPGGLFIAGAAHFNVGNNIVWNNAAAGGSDFGIQSSNTRKTNDIGIVTPGSMGSVPAATDLSVGPDFAPCSGFLCVINFELARSSPLVDVGTDGLAPSGGSDLAGKPRIIGPHTDIGALENDLIFANGFEGL